MPANAAFHRPAPGRFSASVRVCLTGYLFACPVHRNLDATASNAASGETRDA
jgi:hypothetical protein